jgi:adenylate cyclase
VSPEGDKSEVSWGSLYLPGGFFIWGGDLMAEEKFRRKLTAILSADVEGYSRLMGEDEDATIRTLTSYRELMSTLIKKHRGRVVDSPGDNLLAEFLSVVDAVRCAVEIQEELRVRNAELPENRRMEFRIGINLGDVVEEEERIYGDGINIAARVEGLAEGGGICISGTVYDSIKNKLSLAYESLGEHTVKNIKEPVRVYRMRIGPEAAAPVVREEKAGPRRWQKATLAAVAVLVVVAGTWAIWNFYFRPPPIAPASVEKMAYPLPDKPSIAVLPFTNMSGDPNQEFFSDGMTEEIITALSKVPYLLVIARNSTFSYKGKPVKISQVAEELGVRYVLEGSFRKAGDRVRVTAQLIDAIKGHHLWAERYEQEVKDIFALQDEITGNILSALAVKLTKGEQATIRRKGTDNLEAYLKVLQASWYSHRMSKEGHFLARQLAEEAMALDPEYAGPYVLLAHCHIREVFLGWSKSRKKSLEQALELAQKAISLDESSPMCYELLSSIYMFKKQYKRALAEAERAIALDPNGADAYSQLGTVLAMVGRQQEAIAPLEKAIRINPMAPSIYFRRLGTAYRDIGRYEEAIVQLKKAVNLSPDALYPHIGLAATYSLAGRDEEARAEASEVLRIQPELSLESLAKRVAYQNKADIDRIIGALRKAGLPEIPPLPLPDKPSIAVLPFANMSDDPKQEYFSDGITEEIITALSKTPKLFVIARTSSFKYKGKKVDVRTVGRELGVRYVLEGSVRRSEDQLRITAQLVDTKTGNHFWAERYDRGLKDIFALQDEITKKIITAMQVKLTEGEEVRVAAKGTNNLEAYLKYLQANELINRLNSDSNALGKQLAEEAIALDPEYASAYMILSAAHMMDVWLGTSKSPKQSISKAMKLSQKAIVLDDTFAEAHGFLGFLYSMTRQHDKALAQGEKAVALNPNSAECHYRLGKILTFAGRWEESIPEYERAIRLNPIPPNKYIFSLGLAYGWTGQYEEAITWCEKAIRQKPNSFLAHFMLTVVYSLSGRNEEARIQAAEVLRIQPKFSLEQQKKKSTYKKETDREKLFGALRKAGLK